MPYGEVKLIFLALLCSNNGLSFFPPYISSIKTHLEYYFNNSTFLKSFQFYCIFFITLSVQNNNHTKV